MTEGGRRGERERRGNRARERVGILLVVVLAAAAGLLAAGLGTHRSWERETSGSSTSSTSGFRQGSP
jgi:hypothetical protein